MHFQSPVRRRNGLFGMLFSFCTLLTGSIFGIICVIAGLFSVPLGLYTAYVSYSPDGQYHILNGLCSFFVPFYGLIYSIYMWWF